MGFELRSSRNPLSPLLCPFLHWLDLGTKTSSEFKLRKPDSGYGTILKGPCNATGNDEVMVELYAYGYSR